MLWLPGQGQGRGARKRCAPAMSEAAAFAFKAEISLSESGVSSSNVGPDKEALRGLSQAEQGGA